jgi:hypothetical protein
MLIEDLVQAPDYDVDRLAKAQKGLARKSNDFYITNGRLELLIKLMRTDPSSSKITDLINELPWHARTYVVTKVVKVLPNGSPNPSYKRT